MFEPTQSFVRRARPLCLWLALCSLLAPGAAVATQAPAPAPVEEARLVLVVRPAALLALPGVEPLVEAGLDAHQARLERYGLTLPDGVTHISGAVWSDALFALAAAGEWQSDSLLTDLTALDGLRPEGSALVAEGGLRVQVSDNEITAAGGETPAAWLGEVHAEAGDDALHVRMRPSAAARDAHAAVAALRAMRVRIGSTSESDGSTQLALEFTLENGTPARSTAAREELSRALVRVAALPEVAALGVDVFLEAGNASVDGDVVRWSVPVGGEAWASLLEALQDILSEELR